MRQDSFRLATGVFCLTTLVLVNAYATTLISFLAVPKLLPIPNTLEEVSQRTEFKLIVGFNSVLSQKILVSKYISIIKEFMNEKCIDRLAVNIERFG